MLFEFCRYLKHAMALRFRDLAFASAFGVRSSTPCSSAPLRAADCLPLWGDTAARPRTFGMPVCQFAAGHLSKASWVELCGSFGLLGASLGALEALLEPPGALLAASWSLLGRSWGGLRASWDPLGPSWRRSKTRQKQRAFLNPKKEPKKSCTLYFWGSFWAPKSTKNHPKTNQKIKRFSRAKKMLVMSLLEPSWADLGPFWRPSWAPNMRSRTRGLVFGENSRF